VDSNRNGRVGQRLGRKGDFWGGRGVILNEEFNMINVR
jgi:hypothetical protein